VNGEYACDATILFGKGVQGNPLPEREVSSHLLLFPKMLW
jgi:hypothetical protein